MPSWPVQVLFVPSVRYLAASISVTARAPIREALQDNGSVHPPPAKSWSVSGAELCVSDTLCGPSVLLAEPPVDPPPEPVVQFVELLAGVGSELKVSSPAGDQGIEVAEQLLRGQPKA